jgi:hypothetical protein
MFSRNQAIELKNLATKDVTFSVGQLKTVRLDQNQKILMKSNFASRSVVFNPRFTIALVLLTTGAYAALRNLETAQGSK